MAGSRPSAAVAAALAGLMACGSVAQERARLPVTVEARSSDFDYRNQMLVFAQVVIVQGDVRIVAERAQATGLDFQDSQWEFTGQVRITVPGGALASDQARVRFASGAIATATVNGTPATFQQQREAELARGRAGRIEYDHDQGTVELTGEAWLTDGHNEITGTRLVYSLATQRVIARSGDQGGEPVRITIRPREPATATPTP